MGIPLGLVMFQSIGERLNKFASVIIRRAKRASGARCTDATEMNLMLATGMLSSIIITTGAAVFSRYEGWSYFDSFYYCFVTLTTIGFGDYVALQNDQALTQKPGYVALSLVFILFGLAVVAASINLLVLRFMTMSVVRSAFLKCSFKLMFLLLFQASGGCQAGWAGCTESGCWQSAVDLRRWVYIQYEWQTAGKQLHHWERWDSIAVLLHLHGRHTLSESWAVCRSRFPTHGHHWEHLLPETRLRLIRSSIVHIRYFRCRNRSLNILYKCAKYFG